MTDEDRIYADWLDLLGSGIPHTGLLVPEPETAVTESLHRLHDRAEASHQAADLAGVTVDPAWVTPEEA